MESWYVLGLKNPRCRRRNGCQDERGIGGNGPERTRPFLPPRCRRRRVKQIKAKDQEIVAKNTEIANLKAKQAKPEDAAATQQLKNENQRLKTSETQLTQAKS